MGDVFRDLIKSLKKFLTGQVAEYERIYGDKPDIRAMRREIENGV